MIVHPSPQSWEPAHGHYQFGPPSRIVCDPELSNQARLFAEEVRADTEYVIEVESDVSPERGDIVLRIASTDRGYVLDLGDVASVTATTGEGVHHGTRTLLQLLRNSHRIEAGRIRDWPSFSERGIMIDTVPREYSRRWWCELVQELGYLKMNELTVIMGGIALPDSEVTWLDGLCRRNHVNLTPILPLLSHAEDLLQRHPEFTVDPNADGPLIKNAFDFTRPGALEILHAEIEHASSRFSGRNLHVGGDEYLAFPAHERRWDSYPQFQNFAREKTGDESATGADAFIWVLNWLCGVARSHGKTLRVWNDHLELGVVPLDGAIIVEHWYQPTSKNVLTPRQLAHGNPVVNCHDGFTYYDMGWRKLDAAKLWREFDVEGFHGEERKVSGNVLGARLQVWMPESEQAEGRTETNEELADNLFEPLRAFAGLTWNRNSEFENVQRTMTRVGRPPTIPC